MQAKCGVKLRLLFQPLDVRPDFLRLGFEILAVQINPLRILAGVARETGGVDAGAKPDVRVVRPAVFLQQLQPIELE